MGSEASAGVVTPISATATTTAQNLTVGTAMAGFSPLTPHGGAAPYTYSHTGALPKGLSLNSSTGAVTGTPTAAFATTSLVFMVKDANNKVASTTSTVSFTVIGGGTDARPAMAAPPEPYPRLLPLQLIAPPTAKAGSPLAGISVSLLNPGAEAPDARLRLIIHDKDHRHAGGHRELGPDNIKVEVREGESWKPVILGMVESGVMGAIGAEGEAAHRERHKRGGFAIPAGFNKTWQLRVTFGLSGTYSLVASISPDNGSRHLAQPAHSIIEVQ